MTVTAAEMVTQTVIRARAITTTPGLNPALILGRLTIPDADVTVSNPYTVALSFWLTEGKGNDKLNFGTSRETLSRSVHETDRSVSDWRKDKNDRGK